VWKRVQSNSQQKAGCVENHTSGMLTKVMKSVQEKKQKDKRGVYDLSYVIRLEEGIDEFPLCLRSITSYYQNDFSSYSWT
jgi:hypothetical protein